MQEERIKLLERENLELRNRVELLEFRLEMLAENTNISRLLFEYKITKKQYGEIMDLMDEFRNKIDKHEDVEHVTFEKQIERITANMDYHFAEDVARAFMEDGRWEEVFPALYGGMQKYKYYMENKRKGDN